MTIWWRTWIKELVWLPAIAVADVLLINMLGTTQNGHTLELSFNLHDSYYVFTKKSAYLACFFTLTSWVYLVRQAFSRFKGFAANLLLLFASGISVYQYPFLHTMAHLSGLSETTSPGWTIYPPHHAQPVPIAASDSWPADLYILLQCYFIFQLMILVIAGIQTGRSMRTKQQQPAGE